MPFLYSHAGVRGGGFGDWSRHLTDQTHCTSVRGLSSHVHIQAEPDVFFSRPWYWVSVHKFSWRATIFYEGNSLVLFRWFFFFQTGNIKWNCYNAHRGPSRVSVSGALEAVSGGSETIGTVTLHGSNLGGWLNLPLPLCPLLALQVWGNRVKKWALIALCFQPFNLMSCTQIQFLLTDMSTRS